MYLNYSISIKAATFIHLYAHDTLQSKLDCGGHFVVARADLQRHFLLFAGHTTVRYKL